MDDVPLREHIESLIENKFAVLDERIKSVVLNQTSEALDHARAWSIAIGVVTVIVTVGATLIIILAERFWK